MDSTYIPHVQIESLYSSLQHNPPLSCQVGGKRGGRIGNPSTSSAFFETLAPTTLRLSTTPICTLIRPSPSHSKGGGEAIIKVKLTINKKVSSVGVCPSSHICKNVFIFPLLANPVPSLVGGGEGGGGGRTCHVPMSNPRPLRPLPFYEHLGRLTPCQERGTLIPRQFSLSLSACVASQDRSAHLCSSFSSLQSTPPS